MYYTIYKITNQLDGKYYIGKHQTENLEDSYMGSGVLIQRAIKKHGIENFVKEILFIFNSEKEMNDKEKEIVVVSEDTYNLCEGGLGGFGYIHKNISIDYKARGRSGGLKSNTPENIEKLRINGKLHNNFKGRCNTLGFLGKKHTIEWKENHSKIMKGKIPWNKGIPRTKEEKEKIRNGVIKHIPLI